VLGEERCWQGDLPACCALELNKSICCADGIALTMSRRSRYRVLRQVASRLSKPSSEAKQIK
jgi:hypothetical protein